MANFDRLNINSIPIPEIRVHNLNFDLSAYGYHQTRKQKVIFINNLTKKFQLVKDQFTIKYYVINVSIKLSILDNKYI